MPFNLIDLLRLCHAPYYNPRAKHFWLTILHGICWGIWKEHNRRIFEDSAKTFSEIIEAIIFEVTSWAIAYLHFKGLSINDISETVFQTFSMRPRFLVSFLLLYLMYSVVYILFPLPSF